MKKAGRIVALLLVLVMALSVAGCSGKGGGKGGSGKNNGGKKVEIKYWNAGQGTEWLESVVKAFNESQSDWYVEYTATAAAEAVIAAYGQADIDTTDIYIAPGITDTKYMEPLEDILEETAKGDKKKLGEKFSEAYLSLERMKDGHIYSLGTLNAAPGIVYNTKLFEEAGIKDLPRTTNELLIVSDKLTQKNITPWIHFKGGGYYEYLQSIWRAQYDGIDYFNNNVLTLTDASGKSPSKEVMLKKDGRYEALKVQANLITKESVLKGSNSYDHITAQTMFLNDKIGMMVNGAWLGKEMSSIGSIDGYKMMKTPVISSITDKLTTVKSDSDLRKLVSAIDAVTDGKEQESAYKSGDGYTVDGKTVSKADWDYVRTARNTIFSDAGEGGTFIPNYSKEKEGAKAFLKYLFSDEGMKLVVGILRQAPSLALSTGEAYDTSSWNSFEKSALELSMSGEAIVTRVTRKNSHKIFSMSLTNDYAWANYIPNFCATNAADKMTADQAWQKIHDALEEGWDRWVETAK
jgi:ABC-type glycerol-3-phosphate transport system substrate-binding protein